MLLKNVKPHPNYIKLVGEIFLDKEGFPIGVTKKREDKNHIQGLCLSDISFRSDVDGLEQLKNYLVSCEYKGDVNTLIRKVVNYIARTGLNEVYQDYCRTSYMQSCFRRKIIATYSPKNKNFDMGEIANLFISFCRGSTFREFNIADGTFAGYLVNSFGNHFLRGYKKDVFKIINEKGNITSSNDSELDLSSLVAVDMEDFHSSTDFDFARDVRNIHKANSDLFESRKESSSSMISDLLSLYLNYRTSTFDGLLRDEVFTQFCRGNGNNKTISFLSRSGYFIPITLRTFATENSYRLKTLKSRTSCIRNAFKKMHDKIGVTELLEILRGFIEQDRIDFSDKNTSCLFSLTGITFQEGVDPIISVARKLENRKIMLDLINGFLSLHRLIKYCSVKKISMDSIPPEIFKSTLYFKRFDTLEDCLACFDTTEYLINNAPSKGVLPGKPEGLLSNDATYAELDRLIYRSQGKDFSFQVLMNDLKDLDDSSRELEFARKAIDDVDLRLRQSMTQLDFITMFMDAAYGTSEDFSKRASQGDKDLSGDINSLNKLIEEAVSRFHNGIDKGGVQDLLSFLIGNYEGYDSCPVSDSSRYYYLRSVLLNKIKGILSLVGKDDLDLLEAISNKQFNTILKGIGSFDDLEISNDYDRVKLCIIPEMASKYEYQNSVLSRCSFLYDLCVGEHDIMKYIDFCNSFIERKIKELENKGIDTEDRVFINSRLLERSNYIYSSKPANVTSILERIRQKCILYKDYGIFYQNGEPFMLDYAGDKAYVHERGYLILCRDLNIVPLKDEDFRR